MGGESALPGPYFFTFGRLKGKRGGARGQERKGNI